MRSYREVGGLTDQEVHCATPRGLVLVGRGPSRAVESGGPARHPAKRVANLKGHILTIEIGALGGVH